MMKTCLWITRNQDNGYLSHFSNELFGDNEIAISQVIGEIHEQYYLFGLDETQYDFVIVSDTVLDPLPPAEAFLCWLSVLKAGGKLFVQMQNTDLTTHHLPLLSYVVKDAHLWDTHSIVLVKKSFHYPPENWLYYGKQHQDAGEFRQAAQSFEQALAYSPRNSKIYAHLIHLYHQTQWHQAQEHVYQTARRVLSAKAQYQLVADLFNFAEYYDAMRLREVSFAPFNPFERRTPYPPTGEILAKRWRGEDLHGKTLVIWSEFGLGDEMMFWQLTHALKHQLGAAKIIVLTQTPIVSLAQSCPDIDHVLDVKNWQTDLPECDFWEFPYALLSHHNLDLGEYDRQFPYLFADTDKVAQFAPVVSSDKPKIGIAWRGSSVVEFDKKRSIHDVALLDNLLQYLPPNAEIFCLQKDLNDAERAWLQRHAISPLPDTVRDFSDTAELMAHLDYVVSTDTSIIHAAGALGLPASVMIAEKWDWRWSCGHADDVSLWYPSVKRAVGDNWQETFEKIAIQSKSYFNLNLNIS